MEDAARSLRLSTADVYLNVTKAFARMCRILSIPGIDNDECLCRRLNELGLTHDAVQEVIERITRATPWKTAQEDRHLEIMVRSLHQNSCFTTEYLN